MGFVSTRTHQWAVKSTTGAEVLAVLWPGIVPRSAKFLWRIENIGEQVSGVVQGGPMYVSSNPQFRYDENGDAPGKKGTRVQVDRGASEALILGPCIYLAQTNTSDAFAKVVVTAELLYEF